MDGQHDLRVPAGRGRHRAPRRFAAVRRAVEVVAGALGVGLAVLIYLGILAGHDGRHAVARQQPAGPVVQDGAVAHTDPLTSMARPGTPKPAARGGLPAGQVASSVPTAVPGRATTHAPSPAAHPAPSQAQARPRSASTPAVSSAATTKPATTPSAAPATRPSPSPSTSHHRHRHRHHPPPPVPWPWWWFWTVGR